MLISNQNTQIHICAPYLSICSLIAEFQSSSKSIASPTKYPNKVTLSSKSRTAQPLTPPTLDYKSHLRP